MTRDELINALDGLYAYDSGSPGSGVYDERLRGRCISELGRHTTAEREYRLFFSRLVRDMWLSEDALAQGYGIEDALRFVRWLGDRMHVDLGAP